MIPSMWLKATIGPIPKSTIKDPWIPLNYKEICLLSCIYNIYSEISLERSKCMG